MLHGVNFCVVDERTNVQLMSSILAFEPNRHQIGSEVQLRRISSRVYDGVVLGVDAWLSQALAAICEDRSN